MKGAIFFGIILLAIGLACALIPEMLNFWHRLRGPRRHERHVIKVTQESGPRRARPKLKRETPPAQEAEEEQPPA